MTDVDTVTNSSMCQGVLSSEGDNDSTSFERKDLDTHAHVVSLGRNFCVVDDSGRTTEVHPFSPEHESLKVLIPDVIIKLDDPYSGETCMLV